MGCSKTRPIAPKTLPTSWKAFSSRMVEPALTVLAAIIALGLAFDFVNGFHDTANAIATSVATRVLSPGQAVSMAAVFNVIGAVSGTAVATTVGQGIVSPEVVTQQLVAAALISAISWNLFTWWLAIPSSSSHALIFSIVGAGIASAGVAAIEIEGITKTLQGLVYSPVLGFLVALILLMALLWIFARSRPAPCWPGLSTLYFTASPVFSSVCDEAPAAPFRRGSCVASSDAAMRYRWEAIPRAQAERHRSWNSAVCTTSPRSPAMHRGTWTSTPTPSVCGWSRRRSIRTTSRPITSSTATKSA